MDAPGTTATSRLTEWDRFVISEARRLASQGSWSLNAQDMARETLRQLADVAERLDAD
jgi:hypothetical protein